MFSVMNKRKEDKLLLRLLLIISIVFSLKKDQVNY